MLMRHRSAMRWAVLVGGLTTAACVDAPTEKAMRVPPPNQQAVKFWDARASTRWNQWTTDLLQSLPPGTPANGQSWASRTLTYLSLAQYRAVLAATAPSDRPTHASASAAVATASFDVLNAFFNTAANVPDTTKQRIRAQLTQYLQDDGSATGWPGEANHDVAAGEEIGHVVGAAVWSQSQS